MKFDSLQKLLSFENEMMENQTLLSVNGKIQIKCSQSTIENSMLIKELLEFSTMSQCGI